MSKVTKETERRIKANDKEYNSQFKYSNNYIKTCKYTIWSFLPLNLFEQFQRLANFYFLCLLVLSLIPEIRSLSPVTTAIPLMGVLALTAVKDAYDDFQRHLSDNQVNKRKSQTVRDGQLVQEKWANVQAGDIIRMDNNQFVAADILLLSTSEPNGLCFIETAELDGETNLKCRQCLLETAAMKDENTLIGQFDGEILCEAPNNVLNKFEGTLTWKNEKYPLDNDNIILRGCILRNTQWCYGVVIFAGRDTKLMQNSGKTKFKRTNIDKLLDIIIIGMVLLLITMCLFCMAGSGIWESMIGQFFQKYLPWDDVVPKEPLAGATVIALLVFFSYAIVFNTVVPISLYVSVEVIRLMQSFLINWDKQMYYEKSNTSAKARTTTLNEELGQIQYIFSDKTGTLTQNIMVFNKCSILGQCYGDIFDPQTGELIDVSEDTESIDFSLNSNYEPEFKFYDHLLLDDVTEGKSEVHSFFRLLALCHTVMSEEQDGKLEYLAQSPDEAALVSAARNFGFVFIGRTPNSITIEVMEEREIYELLCILDFNNVRKRMSVILKRDDKLILYCKGADNVIYERLKNDQEQIKKTTQDHLDKFAGEGLRTLCLAYKDLDEAYFNDWKIRHQEAAVAMNDRDEKLDAIYEEIEKDLTLIGVTAIEDKLQDGVPETIANLAKAGIKIWVLTGDKQETAINIGYSCQLLTEDMVDPFIIDGKTYEEVEEQLRKCDEDIKKFLTTHCIDPDSSVMFENELNRNNSDQQTVSDNVEDITITTPDVSVVTFRWDNNVGFNQNNSASYIESSGYANESNNANTEEEEKNGFAIIVNGHSLLHCLVPELEKLFLDVVTQCKSVVCCRVTPLQKALVVELVKKNKNAVTLSIGDGANDVPMIKAANIGVGISGQEGLQAVLASDYSIAQFRFLERLLLVHGRWSYYRMCKFLKYFFYKNFASTFCHLWFAFFCGFSAQTVFDPIFIAVYNLIYTALPVLALGIFDQDVNDKYSLLYPKLYIAGQTNFLFNKVEFFRSTVHGCFTSLIIFTIPYGTYKEGMSTHGHLLSDHMLLGSVVASILIFVITVQIALDTSYWTIWNHITIWGSLVSYFVVDNFYNYVFKGEYVGSLTKAMENGTYWFTVLLTLVIAVIPVLFWRFYFLDTFPMLSDIVRLKQRKAQKKIKPTSPLQRTPSSRRVRRTKSMRSSYAFAHQEGFGKLITSGKLMRRLQKISFPKIPSLGILNEHKNNQQSVNGVYSPTDDEVIPRQLSTINES